MDMYTVKGIIYLNWKPVAIHVLSTIINKYSLVLQNLHNNCDKFKKKHICGLFVACKATVVFIWESQRNV